jgi:hypothetical protein
VNINQMNNETTKRLQCSVSFTKDNPNKVVSKYFIVVMSPRGGLCPVLLMCNPLGRLVPQQCVVSYDTLPSCVVDRK